MNKLLYCCYIASELFDDFSKTDSPKGNVYKNSVATPSACSDILVDVLQNGYV